MSAQVIAGGSLLGVGVGVLLTALGLLFYSRKHIKIGISMILIGIGMIAIGASLLGTGISTSTRSTNSPDSTYVPITLIKSKTTDNGSSTSNGSNTNNSSSNGSGTNISTTNTSTTNKTNSGTTKTITTINS